MEGLSRTTKKGAGAPHAHSLLPPLAWWRSGRLDGPSCEGRRSVLALEPASQVAERGSLEAEAAPVALEFGVSLQLPQLSLGSCVAFDDLVLHFCPPSYGQPTRAARARPDTRNLNQENLYQAVLSALWLCAGTRYAEPSMHAAHAFAKIPQPGRNLRV